MVSRDGVRGLRLLQSWPMGPLKGIVAIYLMWPTSAFGLYTQDAKPWCFVVENVVQSCAHSEPLRCTIFASYARTDEILDPASDMISSDHIESCTRM